MEEKNIRIKDFLDKMIGSYVFYMNDKRIDIGEILDNEDELDGFQFEENGIIRLYSNEYERNQNEYNLD